LQVTAGRSRRQERPSSLSTARPFLFSPSLLLVYPPTASLAKVRADGLSRDFSNPAKFPSMGNFKNRLTATQPPNWVAPSQESRPSSKTARVGRSFLAYPGHSCLPWTWQAPPAGIFLFQPRSRFPYKSWSCLPQHSSLPCTKQAPAQTQMFS